MTRKLHVALPDLPTLAQRLAWAREQRGLGSVDLSIEAGFSHSAVSRIESGVARTIEAQGAFRLADAIGVDARWLVMGMNNGAEYKETRRGRSQKKSKGAIAAERTLRRVK